MLKIENVAVTGWDAAIRGMRNPLNSWEQSDSAAKYNLIGQKDLELAKKLSKAGTDHSKFLRMINVTFDITAPMYWWAQWDTYKVGTVRNSCSKMHKLADEEFTINDFSHEHLDEFSKTHLNSLITYLNSMRDMYNQSKNKHYWWQMVQMLPESYNQRSTVQVNYQVLKSMYHARKRHRLSEWVEFCIWMESLPYFKEICTESV